MLIEGKCHYNSISILKIYALNSRTPKFVKETPLQLKSHIDPHTPTVGDFNISLSPMDRSSRQKLNKEIQQLTDFINQISITIIHRTFHTNIKEYTLFFTPHGTFSKIDHIHRHKTSLNRYKNIE